MRMIFGFSCMDPKGSPAPYCPAQLLDITQFPEPFDDQGLIFGADHLFRFAGSVRVAWVSGLGRIGGNLFLGFLLHSYT